MEKNSCISIQRKLRIQIACIRLVMTYKAETRADTVEVKRMARRNDKRILEPPKNE